MAGAERQEGLNERRRKVMVVDDHPIVHEGLADLINKEKDLVVCGWGQDIPQAIKTLKEVNPDVVTVDISLGDANGLELIKSIKARFPGMPVLVLSMHQESFYAERALRAGARGYITKQEATKNIILAIRKVLDGGVYLSEAMKDKLLYTVVGYPNAEGGASPIDRLTDRELEVFGLLGEGRGTREIAERLCLSVKTVGTHRARIKTKLHLKSSSELLQQAFAWVQGRDRLTSL